MAGAAQSGVQQSQVARYITCDFRLPVRRAWRQAPGSIDGS